MINIDRKRVLHFRIKFIRSITCSFDFIYHSGQFSSVLFKVHYHSGLFSSVSFKVYLSFRPI